MLIPDTTTRVNDQTDEQVNRQIALETNRRVACIGRQGPEAIQTRLKELDREWDIERVLETNASSVVLFSTVLGFTVDRRWFVMPGIVAAFLLQHAVQGWCPPILWFRRLGYRTASEIDHERYALKAMRGDFGNEIESPAAALAAARY